MESVHIIYSQSTLNNAELNHKKIDVDEDEDDDDEVK